MDIGLSLRIGVDRRASGILSVSADHPVELRRAAEVQEQADFELGRAEVVVELPFRVTMQVLSRFDLDNHLVADDQVKSLMRNLGAVVSDDNIELPVDTVGALEQFAFERGSVHVFEKSEPQCSVHRKKAPITERVSSSSIKCIAKGARELTAARHRSITQRMIPTRSRATCVARRADLTLQHLFKAVAGSAESDELREICNSET
jgi:hypothetical protein